MPPLGTPSAQQGQASTPNSSTAAKEGESTPNKLPPPTPLPAPTSATADTPGAASTSEFPFIEEVVQLHDAYSKAHAKYLLYYRCVCTGALFVAFLLFLVVLLDRQESMVVLMNPFHTADSKLLRLLLALSNLLFVSGLLTGVELKAVAERNGELATLASELVDAAMAAAGSSGSLSGDVLGQLEGKKAAIEREAERKPLSLRDPVGMCLGSVLGGQYLLTAYVMLRLKVCKCLPPPEEGLLGADVPRSDDLDLEAGGAALMGALDGVSGKLGEAATPSAAATPSPADSAPSAAGQVKPPMAPRRPGAAAPGAAPTAAGAAESDWKDSDDDDPPDDDEDEGGKQDIKQDV